ncbi:MAG: hypothetical protein J5838_00170, partial [Desulfovibrio sp.]|nr:hypothetical protein [Desulfovibrio sp.]
TCCAVLFRHRMHPFVIFGTVGVVDTCFSFLNMGSLSLGLPLLCYSLSIWNDNERSDKNVALQFYACIGWCIGFISPWVVKWCLVLIVFDISIPELFGDTLNSYPTGSLDRIFLAIFRDVSELHWLLGSIVLFILWHRKKCKSIPIRKDLLPALLPALIPFIWIAIIPGQAGIKHSSFYNLILWPAIAAIFLLFLSLPSKRHDRLVSDSNSPAKYMSSDNL